MHLFKAGSDMLALLIRIICEGQFFPRYVFKKIRDNSGLEPMCCAVVRGTTMQTTAVLPTATGTILTTVTTITGFALSNIH